ncbi:MAG TPA: hypothetical protein V6C52_08865 [Coleofasciculaceae cyanobacterium]|jgi:hypothetical protein
MTHALMASFPTTMPPRNPALRFGHMHNSNCTHAHAETGHILNEDHSHLHEHEPASPLPTETTPKGWLHRTMRQIALFFKELIGGFFKDVFGEAKHPAKHSHSHPH